MDRLSTHTETELQTEGGRMDPAAASLAMANTTFFAPPLLCAYNKIRICPKSQNLSFQVKLLPRSLSSSVTSFQNLFLASSTLHEEPCMVLEGGNNGTGGINNGGGNGGSWGKGGDNGGSDDSSALNNRGGILGFFFQGWKDRVKADPQFAFKVLMEEVVGVGANVLGDMASRPNFGLNELDFVFSTIVVGSILNFTLMYLLAPTSSAAAIGAGLPGIFAKCPAGHMFEPGAYSLLDRGGTFVYKGLIFSGVGFLAGLFGTALSNGLLNARKKMDQNFVLQNKPPPTFLNAVTWGLHMAFSSNLRYQALNGFEFGLANMLPPSAFKASVLLTRALNNLLGGYTFVLLARITGSQKSESTRADCSKEVTENLISNSKINFGEFKEARSPTSISQNPAEVGSQI